MLQNQQNGKENDMKENEKRPEGSRPERGDISLYVVETPKDKNNLSIRQTKVLNLLRRGKHSAADITIVLGYCHPASYIRTLRDKGFNILDEWVEGEDTRFKRYWIK